MKIIFEPQVLAAGAGRGNGDTGTNMKFIFDRGSEVMLYSKTTDN